MKMYKTIFLVLTVISLLFSCKKNKPLTSQEKLEGKWTAINSNIMGSDVAGDGSYLTFNAFSSTSSTGVDFKASDNTTGNFTYSLNEAATLLTINDTSSNGGNWNATWDVLELTETQLKITATTIFGNLTVTYSK